jgi:ectoine hydroxylase-related dioxygenase (phytanoyl-CoA dioxygenase family)
MPVMTRSRSKHPLHTDGYFVIKNAISISPSIMEELKKMLASKSVGPIFNGLRKLGATADNRRLQVNIRQDNRVLQKIILEIESSIRTAIPEFTQNLTFNDWVAIKSLANCQEQPPHTDFVPTQEFIDMMQYHCGSMPLLCLISTMPNTYFDVWSGSINLIQRLDEDYSRAPITRRRIELDEGDILIFRPDLIHAGSAYSVENIRLHAYMDSPFLNRVRNRTWIIHKNCSDKLKNYIRDQGTYGSLNPSLNEG